MGWISPQITSQVSAQRTIGDADLCVIGLEKPTSGWSPNLPTCCDVSKVRYAQHDLPSWIGGHGTVAYEQYTQQSPSSGFKTVWQDLHS